MSPSSSRQLFLGSRVLLSTPCSLPAVAWLLPRLGAALELLSRRRAAATPRRAPLSCSPTSPTRQAPCQRPRRMYGGCCWVPLPDRPDRWRRAGAAAASRAHAFTAAENPTVPPASSSRLHSHPLPFPRHRSCSSMGSLCRAPPARRCVTAGGAVGLLARGRALRSTPLPANRASCTHLLAVWRDRPAHRGGGVPGGRGRQGGCGPVGASGGRSCALHAPLHAASRPAAGISLPPPLALAPALEARNPPGCAAHAPAARSRPRAAPLTRASGRA